MNGGYLVTRHAVERYQERVKPALDSEAAGRELDRLVAGCGEPVSEPPVWKHSHDPDARYLNPCDGLAFVVIADRVVSVVTRGGHGDESIVTRRAFKKKKREHKRSGRNKSPGLHRETSRKKWEEI